MDQNKKDVLLSLITFVLVFLNFLFSLGDDRLLGKILLGAASCFALIVLLRDLRAKSKTG